MRRSLYERPRGLATGLGIMLRVLGVAVAIGPLSAATHAQQSAVEPQPRVPEDTTRLLTDAELAVPRDSSAVDEDSAYSAWVRTHAQAIRSLGASDFSDLRFLAPLLKGKRIVQLGESSHGVAEFSLAKARLIRYLHEELGYDVIAFESPFVGCERAQQLSASLSPVELMRRCITSVWHASEVLPLLDYMKATQRTARPLLLAGVDVQFLAQDRFAIDSDNPAVARQMARSHAVWDQFWRATDRRGQIRDRGMADNLEFLLTERHPGKKIIVWAHNAHIAHVRRAPVANTDTSAQQPTNMGGWIAQRRRPELYTIGLYMYRGSAADNDRRTYPIRQSRGGSLESILHQAPWRYSFVDFSNAKRERGSGWIWTAIEALQLGTTPERLVPRNTYDAVLFIDEVHPPDYR